MIIIKLLKVACGVICWHFCQILYKNESSNTIKSLKRRSAAQSRLQCFKLPKIVSAFRRIARPCYIHVHEVFEQTILAFRQYLLFFMGEVPDFLLVLILVHGKAVRNFFIMLFFVCTSPGIAQFIAQLIKFCEIVLHSFNHTFHGTEQSL